MLLQMVVSIVVARLLVPEDFGVMAILTFFTAVALVVVDSGFSQTLLRKESPSDDDYKSVFLFNLAVSVLLYLLFVAVAPLLADYYNLAVIAKIAPVLFLLLPLNALGIIQNTKLSREFRFGVLSRINFIASLVAGVAAIAIALCGGGVWALVAQRLSVVAVKSLLLWWRGDWRGEGKFNGSAWRAMAPFSFRLMSTDIVSAIYKCSATLYRQNLLGRYTRLLQSGAENQGLTRSIGRIIGADGDLSGSGKDQGGWRKVCREFP